MEGIGQVEAGLGAVGRPVVGGGVVDVVLSAADAHAVAEILTVPVVRHGVGVVAIGVRGVVGRVVGEVGGDDRGLRLVVPIDDAVLVHVPAVGSADRGHPRYPVDRLCERQVVDNHPGELRTGLHTARG